MVVSVLFLVFPLFQCNIYFFHLKINNKNNIFVQGRENKVAVFLIFDKIISLLSSHIVILLSKRHIFLAFVCPSFYVLCKDLWVGSVCIMFCLIPNYFFGLILSFNFLFFHLKKISIIFGTKLKNIGNIANSILLFSSFNFSILFRLFYKKRFGLFK